VFDWKKLSIPSMIEDKQKSFKDAENRIKIVVFKSTIEHIKYRWISFSCLKSWFTHRQYTSLLRTISRLTDEILFFCSSFSKNWNNKHNLNAMSFRIDYHFWLDDLIFFTARSFCFIPGNKIFRTISEYNDKSSFCVLVYSPFLCVNSS